MKKILKGWKEGVLSKTLRSRLGITEHEKGSVIRYKRKRKYDDNGTWTGEFEYHYLDQNNFNLVVGSEKIY